VERKPLEGNTSIELKIVEIQNRRIRIDGESNLPTRTQIIISVTESVPNGSIYQSKTAVRSDGSFQSEVFGANDGLQEGKYIADVTVPYFKVQPSDVQKQLGKNGENLKGPLVKTNELFGSTASLSKEFIVGNADALQIQSNRSKELARKYRDWLNKIVELHQRLQVARSTSSPQSNNLESLANWGRFARQYQSDNQQLQQELMTMPLSVRITLGDPLDCILTMFHATATPDSKRFATASEEYEQAIKELVDFVEKSEREVN
jgi:hypothetical protein